MNSTEKSYTDILTGDDSVLMNRLIKKDIGYYKSEFSRLEKKKVKLSWNWGAFFGGHYWFFYRKISGFKFLALLLNILIVYYMSPVMYDLMNELFTSASEGDINLFGVETYIQNFNLTSIVLFASLIFVQLPRIPYALLANHIYKQHCISTIANIKRVHTDESKAQRAFNFKKGMDIIGAIVAIIISVSVFMLVSAACSQRLLENGLIDR